MNALLADFIQDLVVPLNPTVINQLVNTLDPALLDGLVDQFLIDLAAVLPEPPFGGVGS